MNRFYLTIRKLTVVPVMAAAMLAAFRYRKPETFQSTTVFALGVLFLGIFPLLAYPLQKHIPSYRDRGREGQRSLAMVFAVAGYVLGLLSGLLFHAPTDTLILYLEYLVSGIVITIFNKCFHIKLSGHACGIFAPIGLFLYFQLYACAFIGCIVAVLVYAASLQTKRHTLPQLIGGSIVPLAVLVLIDCYFAFFSCIS